MRRTGGIESTEIRHLNGGEVFAAHHCRHVATRALVAPMDFILCEKFCLRGMAILALLLQTGHGIAVSPIVRRDLVGIVTGAAADAIFIVSGVVALRTLRSAGRGFGLEECSEGMLWILLRLLLIPGKALMAALAVGRHPSPTCSIEMSAGAVALLAGDALADGVLA